MHAHKNMYAGSVLVRLTGQPHTSILTLGSCVVGSYGASAVYVEDAAALYLLATKHAQAGHIYHAASGQGTGKQIAEALAVKHKLEAKSISRAENDTLYGPELGMFFAVENLNNSQKALRELGWQPKSDSAFFLSCLSGKVP